MDKIRKHMDSQCAKVAKFQGGAVRDAGPDSAKDPKASGDAVTNSSMYTKQDQSREQGGPPKNPYHAI